MLGESEASHEAVAKPFGGLSERSAVQVVNKQLVEGVETSEPNDDCRKQRKALIERRREEQRAQRTDVLIRERRNDLGEEQSRQRPDSGSVSVEKEREKS